MKKTIKSFVDIIIEYEKEIEEVNSSAEKYDEFFNSWEILNKSKKLISKFNPSYKININEKYLFQNINKNINDLYYQHYQNNINIKKDIDWDCLEEYQKLTKKFHKELDINDYENLNKDLYNFKIKFQ